MEKTVSFPIVADIMAMADEMEIHSQTYTDHEIVCRREDKEVIHYRERIHMPLITASDILSVLPRPPYKVHCIHLTDKDRLEALKGKVERKYAGQITAQFSNDQYLEFYTKQERGMLSWRYAVYSAFPKKTALPPVMPPTISLCFWLRAQAWQWQTRILM